MKYGVTIPISGIAYVEVEANSRQEAIDKAFEEKLEICEWEALERIVSGNVFNGHTNEVCAEEIE